ncbi:MAG: PQQ-binding-like beta-propeller repeat protein [Planctomycetaceae bacterium]|nr:PQQ-binding-like beta-propeller repeat protein [Planctomycetales bacterium]MCB9922361.1 PQQ-binding-like beta-propeller repeat protein [Planctomycetaceae bacterium]
MAFLRAAHTEDWLQWRGPDRRGISGEDSGWDRQSWPVGDAAWTIQVGAGGSAPIVADGRLYTIGWENGRDYVRCFTAATGQALWEQSYDCPMYGRQSEGDQGLYSGPSVTPVFDRDTGYLFTLSTDGHLNCWDTSSDGRRVWGLNFYDQFDVPQRPLVGSRRLRDYGYTASPLVHGDWIIAEVGDDTGNLIAFSKRTGKQVWASQSKDPAGHTGGLVPITVEGIPCVAVMTIRNLLVSRLDQGHEGETLAEFPWVTDFANSIATPAVIGSSVVITSEYNQYSICKVDITRGGAQLAWKQPYASGVCSPVVHKGFVYWCWRGVYCLDFATGKPIWRGGRFGDTASLLATADDRLIVWADRGELVLVESANREPTAFKELARKNRIFTNDAWPHLVLADGRLFCKDRDGNMKCFKL